MRFRVDFEQHDDDLFVNFGDFQTITRKVNPDIDVTASVDSGVGTPSVEVTKTKDGDHYLFDLAFSNMRGNGIADISLVSQSGLEKTYRITTDAGDYYDMVLSDGNGIASTSFNADNTLTLTFTDGTSYTTPSLMPDLSIGTVRTVSSGQGAAASIHGSHGVFYLDLDIPEGNGISRIAMTGRRGNISIYTIFLDDGSSYPVEITNANIDDTANSGSSVTWSVDKLLSEFGSPGQVYTNDTAGWNSDPTLVAEEGAFYVYTDAATYDGQLVPRLKIGDGSTYLIDLPFLNDPEYEHMNDTTVHITAAERQLWNNKVTTYEPQNETLILSKS